MCGVTGAGEAEQVPGGDGVQLPGRQVASGHPQHAQDVPQGPAVRQDAGAAGRHPGALGGPGARFCVRRDVLRQTPVTLAQGSFVSLQHCLAARTAAATFATCMTVLRQVLHTACSVGLACQGTCTICGLVCH